jgi:DNA polymerase-4
VSVKIRRADFKTYSRQCVLGQPTQDTSVVSGAARRLLAGWLAEQPNAALRLLGVGAGDLGTLRQADLFVTEPAKDTRLDAAVDGIRGRFGSAVITRARLLPRGPYTGSGPRRG